MMSNIKFTNLFKAAPILLGASFIAAQAQPAFAQNAGSSEQELLQQIDNYNDQGSSNSLNQVNSVFQLRDVSPGDWAFEALRNLVERYGCIAGYPDGTYRGNRALTRYEFAAGLNACLQQIERLIAANQGEVTREDLAALERLMQEFEAELATLGTRVDNLEGRVGFLEDNQFSTTTKLTGSVVFMNAIAFGDEKADGTGDDVDSNVGFLYDAVLDFEASFTGRDELKVSFQAADFGNGFTSEATGTADAGLDNDEDTGGDFVLEDLIYTFPLGDKIEIAIGANDMDVDETWSYNFGSGGEINDFTQDNPFALDGEGFDFGVGEDDADGTGISANIGLTERISLGLGYTTKSDLSSDPEFGLFTNYNAGANLNYAGNNFDLGLTYNFLQISQGDDSDFDAVPTDAQQHTVDLHGALRLGSRTEVGGWVGYVDRQAEIDGVGEVFEDDGFTFGANLSFFDIGKEGSKLGLAFATPPFFTDLEEDRTYIAEVSYDFPVNDNIAITPGFFAVFNPNRDEDNDTVYVGVLRTSFSF